MKGYAPGGARRATATRSQEFRGPAPAASSHLSGAGNEGIAAHQRGVGHAVGAHPPVLCTSTKADTCTPLNTECVVTAGRFSSSSSPRRYGRNSLKGLRGGSGAEEYVGCAAGGGEGRRTDRSIGSVVMTGSGTGIAAGNGVGTCTGVGRAVGGGDGKRALSGDPAA